MLPLIADVVFVLVAVGTAWFVARRLLLEATMMLLAIVLASLIAIVTFEPAAYWCNKTLFVEGDFYLTQYLWGFLGITIFAYAAIMLYNVFVRVIVDPPIIGGRIESLGCISIGCISGYWLAAFLLTIVQTIPGSRDFGGVLQPEADRRESPIMTFAPDYQFLTFVDYTCVPHKAITGVPWRLDGPAVNSPVLQRGRWLSFPVRYSIWREQVAYLSANADDESTYEDEYSSESSDGEMGEQLPKRDEDAVTSTRVEESSDEYPDDMESESETQSEDDCWSAIL